MCECQCCVIQYTVWNLKVTKQVQILQALTTIIWPVLCSVPIGSNPVWFQSGRVAGLFVVCYLTVCSSWELCWRAGKVRVGWLWLGERRQTSFNWCLVGAQRTNRGSTLQLSIAKDVTIKCAQWCIGHNMVKLQLSTLNACSCQHIIMCKTQLCLLTTSWTQSYCFKLSN